MIEKNKILEEIREYQASLGSVREEMQEGDITYTDLEEHLHMGRGSVKKLMDRLIDEGKYTRHYVRTPTAMRIVFRKT